MFNPNVDKKLVKSWYGSKTAKDKRNNQMNLEAFRKRIREYCQPTGYTQKELARALGLHTTSLSHKLNGTGRTYLTHPEIKQIIKLMAEWGAITKVTEAHELLELVNLKPAVFSNEEWKTSPLNQLENEPAEARFVALNEKQVSLKTASLTTPSQAKQTLPVVVENLANTTVGTIANQRWANLPARLNSFVGREQELEELTTFLQRPNVRLVNLLGPGGVGKTRLSLQVAEKLLSVFEHGVCFVPLAYLNEAQQVVPALAQALGVKETGTVESLLKAIQTRLQDKEILLLLDNFEQVWEAGLDLVTLLEELPRLKIVVTSRVVLNLYGEYEYNLNPLSLPDLATTDLELNQWQTVQKSEAVQLFVERAQAVKFNFNLNAANAEAVAAICQRLDGIPLAIELAAGQSKLLSPQAILEQLTQTEETESPSLDFVGNIMRNQAPRQQTLRATLDWSFRLLSTGEQTLFARLGIFAGGCTLEAVQNICYSAENVLQRTVLQQLRALVDKSMLAQIENAAGQPSFSLLQTMHEYAREQLIARGEWDFLSKEHFRYYRNFAESSAVHLRNREQAKWLKRLEQEHANFVAALAWAKEHGTGLDILQLASGLGYFWELHTHLIEGQRWLDAALSSIAESEATTEPAYSLYTRGLLWLGALALRQGDLQQAKEKLEKSVQRYRQNAKQDELAEALTYLGILQRQQGKSEEAVCLYEESYQLFRQTGDSRGIAGTLAGLASVALQNKSFEQAQEFYQQSLALFKQLEDASSSGQVLNSLGEIARHQEDWAQAATYYRQSLAILEKANDKMGCAIVWHNLGHVERHCGQLDAALAAFKKSLRLNQELGRQRGIANCLVGLAGVLAEQEQTQEQAVRLLGTAEALRENIGTVLDSADALEHSQTVASLTKSLGETTFRSAWENGRNLPANAIQLALNPGSTI